MKKIIRKLRFYLLAMPIEIVAILLLSISRRINPVVNDFVVQVYFDDGSETYISLFF